MNTEEAIKAFKPRRKVVSRGEKVLLDKAHKFLKLVSEEEGKADYRYIGLSDGLYGVDDRDLRSTSKITGVNTVEDGKVYYNAEDSWAYGGYAEGCIIIPIENLDMTPEQIRKTCHDNAIKHYEKEIKSSEREIEYRKEKIKSCEEQIKKLRKQEDNE